MKLLRKCGACGSEWLRLVESESSAGFMDATVCVDEDDNIAHYSGIFVCARCDEPLAGRPTRPGPDLRLVGS